MTHFEATLALGWARGARGPVGHCVPVEASRSRDPDLDPGRAPTCNDFGVSEGIRTPDTQDHNLVL